MRTTNIVILPVILIVAGGIGWTACHEAPRPSPSAAPAAVQTKTLAPQSVPAVLRLPGSIRPRHHIMLSAQIIGFVREMRVREGDMVNQGQVLAVLDARDAESQKAAAQAGIEEADAALAEARRALEASEQMLAGAKASAKLAESTLARYQKLAEARSVAPQELDEVRARRDAAAADVAAREAMTAAARDRLRQIEARIAQARAQLQRTEVVVDWTLIRAPARARVVRRMADPGSAIFPGSPLLAVETTEDLQVVASIPTSHARLLKRGMEVAIRGDAESSVSMTGRISEIVPASDPSTHTMQFKADLPAGDAPPPGQFVTVEVPAGDRQALLIPRRSVRETGQLTGVFVVDGASVAHFRLVRISQFDAERVEVLSGAAGGERIVVQPDSQVVDGTPVEVRP